MGEMDELRQRVLRLDPGQAEELAGVFFERFPVMRIRLGEGEAPAACYVVSPFFSDAYRRSLALGGIERTPGVCGGAARVVRTRIPVWVLEQMRRLGISEADILRSYPSLRAADLVQAWAYVDHHPGEIDEQIRENEAA